MNRNALQVFIRARVSQKLRDAIIETFGHQGQSRIVRNLLNAAIGACDDDASIADYIQAGRIRIVKEG